MQARVVLGVVAALTLTVLGLMALSNDSLAGFFPAPSSLGDQAVITVQPQTQTEAGGDGSDSGSGGSSAAISSSEASASTPSAPSSDGDSSGAAAASKGEHRLAAILHRPSTARDEKLFFVAPEYDAVKQPEAWVTFAYEDSYCRSAVVLLDSIRRAGTKRPRVAMVTPDISSKCKEMLKKVGAEVEVVQPVESTESALPSWWSGVWTKMRAWTLTKYKKVVLMDADVIMLRSADELFAYPELSATPGLFEHMNGECPCFSSGLVVLQPNQTVFDELVKFGRSKTSFVYPGDLGLLNEFFIDKWYPLPLGLHAMNYMKVTNINSHVGANDQDWPNHFNKGIKILHFTMQKPWMGAQGPGESYWHQIAREVGWS